MGNNDVLFVHKVERNFMKFSEKVNSPGPLNILFFYLDNFAIFHHSLELPITLALLYFFIVLITFYHDIKHFYYVFVCSPTAHLYISICISSQTEAGLWKVTGQNSGQRTMQENILEDFQESFHCS